MQIIYGINPKMYLKNELEWLRNNGIEIVGTVSHGSDYCYVYHYVNSYFWEEVPGTREGNFYNWEYITKDHETFKIEKDKLSNYNFQYEGSFLHADYFFSDSDWPGGKRWHMGRVNLDTIQPGKKVILLIHPQHWEQ